MSYDSQIQRIMEDWLVENNRDKVDANAAAKWAVENNRYKRPPISIEEMCKRDMLRVLREARHEDPQGRTVKTRYSLKYVGEQRPLYLDIRTAKPAEMHESFTQNFDRLTKGVRRHAIDVSSYNDNNLYHQQIPLFDYDMNPYVSVSNESTEYDDEYDDSYDGGEGGDDGVKAAGQD